MSQRADFLFDDEQDCVQQQQPAPASSAASAPLATPIESAVAIKSLDLLRGVQILLVEVLAAIKNLGADYDGHASAMRTLNSGRASDGLRCDTKFKKPRGFTVTCNIDTPGVFAQMTVEWRLDGAIIQRTVDVAAGASISGFGQSVTVTVNDNTTKGLYAAANSPVNYIVTVTISPGVRPGNGVPLVQTGLAQATINAGATKSVAVPTGANGVLVYSESGGVPAALYVDQQTPKPAVGGATTLSGMALNALQTAPMPLAAGVSQILITNQGAGQAAVTVLFTIDG